MFKSFHAKLLWKYWAPPVCVHLNVSPHAFISFHQSIGLPFGGECFLRENFCRSFWESKLDLDDRDVSTHGNLTERVTEVKSSPKLTKKVWRCFSQVQHALPASSHPSVLLVGWPTNCWNQSESHHQQSTSGADAKLHFNGEHQQLTEERCCCWFRTCATTWQTSGLFPLLS